MQIGQPVYVRYKGCKWYAEIISYEFPRYTVRLTNGLELSFYADEMEKA